MQIAESVGGKRRIVRHLGSAHDEAQLGLLMTQARQLLADDHQGVLDLGLTPKMVKASLIPAPAETLLPEAPDHKRQLVAAGRVVKSSSAVLYDPLAGVYSSLGFDVVDDAVFEDLVIARVVEPTSVLDADRVLAELGPALGESFDPQAVSASGPCR